MSAGMRRKAARSIPAVARLSSKLSTKSTRKTGGLMRALPSSSEKGKIFFSCIQQIPATNAGLNKVLFLDLIQFCLHNYVLLFNFTMEMPHVYTVQFSMDTETPPHEIITQIELATQPDAIFQLEACVQNIFRCSTMSQTVFKNLCEKGFTTKEGQKVSVIPNLKSVRGILVRVRSTIRERVFLRKLKKYGNVMFFSLKCVKDPDDPDYNIWGCVMVFHKNITRHISIGGCDAMVAIQGFC